MPSSVDASRPSSSGNGIAPPGYRLPGGTRLGAVRLQVADAARSEEFYGRVLGMVRRNDAAGIITLGSTDGAEHLIELVERKGAKHLAPRSRLGLFHFALLLPERADLGRFACHAGRLGIRLGMGDHLVSESLYLTDPDGLGIEVYADRPRADWRSQGAELVMATDPLDLEDLLGSAGPAPFDGLPSGTVIGHVHLHVGDLTDAERFYHTALGFDKVVWTYPGALFLAAAGYHHHVGTNAWAAGAPSAGPDDARLLAWTLVLPEAADVTRLKASVVAAGYHAGRLGERGGLLIDDPWGTPLEILAGDADHRVR